MPRPRLGRALAAIGAITIAVLCATALTPASADVITIAGTITLNGVTGQDTPNPQPAPGSLDFSITGDLTYRDTTVPPANIVPECVNQGDSLTTDPTTGAVYDASDFPKLCLGHFGSGTTTLVQHPFVKQHAPGLDGLVAEGIDAIAALYDLPNDVRIETYAPDALRAYLVMRLTNILNKKIFGEELTPNEQAAFDYMKQSMLTVDKAIAQDAKEEYDKYEAEKCLYTPPPAPPYASSAAVGLPDDMKNWCNQHHTTLSVSTAFAPPMPSADDFRIWGLYRASAELGMNALGDPHVQGALSGTALAGIGFAALAGASIVTGGITALVGTSAALSTTVATLMGSQGIVAASFAPEIVAGVAVGATASVVGVVLFAVVIIAISIAELVEQKKIGDDITSEANAAQAETDPFSIDTYAARYTGRTIDDGFDSDLVPPWHGGTMSTRILQLVTIATTVDTFGHVVPDTSGIWSGAEPRETDWHFDVKDPTAPGGWREASTIEVPQSGGGFEKVSFSDGWVVLTDADGQTRPALNFRFVDADGKDQLATRARYVKIPGVPFRTPGFILGDLGTDGTSNGRYVTEISFKNADGQVETVKPVAPPATTLQGPLPTAVGPLVPGRVVSLRPNPVDSEGNFGLDRFRDDYAYTWTVQRYDAQSDRWVPQPLASSDGYGATVIPTQVGDYSATITMTNTRDDTEQPMTGTVEFSVQPPPISVERLNLEDNGTDGLAIDLQLSSIVPSDTFTVDVAWPGSVGSSSDEPDVSHFTIACQEIDATACQTERVYPGTDPSDASRTLSPLTDIAKGADVTITDDYGMTLTRHIAQVNPERPAFAAPDPLPAGTDGMVSFTDRGVSATVPVQSASSSAYDIARIVPGSEDDAAGAPTFGLFHPDTGTATNSIDVTPDGVMHASVVPAGAGAWKIQLQGHPDVADIGSYDVPLILQQTNGARSAPMMLHVDVAPATGNRYRGAVTADTSDPTLLPQLIPFVMGGSAGDGGPAAKLCVSFERRDVPANADSSAQVCQAPERYLAPDGTAAPLDLPTIHPQGFPHGVYWAQGWLTSSARADTTPIELGPFVPKAPPTVSDLRWRDNGRTAEYHVEAGEDDSVAEVTCTIDARSLPCSSTSATVPSSLGSGDHTLRVFVRDASGNYTTAELALKVSSTPPGQPGDAGTPGGPGHSGTPGKPRHPGTAGGGHSGTAGAPGHPAPGASSSGGAAPGSPEPAASGAGPASGAGTEANPPEHRPNPTSSTPEPRATKPGPHHRSQAGGSTTASTHPADTLWVTLLVALLALLLIAVVVGLLVRRRLRSPKPF